MPYYGIIFTLPETIEAKFNIVGYSIPIEDLPNGDVGCYSAETRWSSQL